MKQWTKHIPVWVQGVFPLVFVLFVLFNLYYRLGSSGVEVSGTSASFEREFDYQLYAVNDTYAFSVDGPNWTPLVRYLKTPIPFRWICGTYQSGGVVLRDPVYRKGNLLFSGQIGFHGGEYGIDLKSGQVYRTTPPSGPGVELGDYKLPEPFAQKELYTALGIDPATDTTDQVTSEKAVLDFEKLSVANESSIVFNAAFLLIFGGIFLFALGSVVLGALRSTQTA
jgi:hypothetical protein